MTAGDPNGRRLRAEHQSSVARDDWHRYGLSGRSGTVEGPRDALGRPVDVPERREAPDDLFLQYRHETSQGAQRPHRAERSPRFMANVATVAVIGVLGSGLLMFGLATSPPTPASPSPSRFGSASASPSGPTISIASSGPRTAHVNFLIDLPVSIAITDRERPVDDGTTMYLTGSGGGVAVNETRGTIGTVYGGPAFAAGVRRAVVDTGIWVSSWPASAKICGPACWPQATTHRIDFKTGTVSKTLAATYLLGATDDGIWVATGKVVDLLDPATGAVLSSLAWPRATEPRVGCGALWSFGPGSQESTLFQIDPKSGAVLGASSLDPSVTYGPVTIKDQCWMTTGSNGATTGGPATLVWLNADGTVQATFDYPGLSVVVIDGEFWLYGSGTLQRLEPTSGVGFGASYTLAVQPPDGDPSWLFSASHTLWMIDGTALVSLGVPTGPANAAG
jgi:hypothetical protein